MSELVRGILALPGIHYLASRWGGQKMRSLSFDGKFLSGDWKFNSESADLIRVVENYCSNGDLLALGCGTAAILNGLVPGSFQTFLGIDLSEEALSIASGRKRERARFELADMVSYRPARSFDVILFSNSFYYVKSWSRQGLLRRLSKSLTPNGKIIVSIAQPERYSRILQMIRRGFSVDLDRALEDGHGHVLVFR